MNYPGTHIPRSFAHGPEGIKRTSTLSRIRALHTQQFVKLVEIMETFAARANSDTISVRVSRVAERLGNFGAPFEKPLSSLELNVIETFLNEV